MNSKVWEKLKSKRHVEIKTSMLQEVKVNEEIWFRSDRINRFLETIDAISMTFFFIKFTENIDNWKGNFREKFLTTDKKNSVLKW